LQEFVSIGTVIFLLVIDVKCWQIPIFHTIPDGEASKRGDFSSEGLWTFNAYLPNDIPVVFLLLTWFEHTFYEYDRRSVLDPTKWSAGPFRQTRRNSFDFTMME
jgi:hypothetical protein